MQKVLSAGIARQFTSTVIVNVPVTPQTAVGKEKYTLLYHFCKVVLHCTTRRRKQSERLRTRKKISLQHKAIKGYCPQNAFSKSTCKLLKIDQVSCRSVSKSCYRVQVFDTSRQNHLTPVTQRCRQAWAKYCRPPRLFC